MRIWQMVLCTAFAATLTGQETGSGFGWVGLRAGTLAFDPQDHLKNGTFLGGQAGLVFGQQRYGFSVEGLTSKPEGEFVPSVTYKHSESSITLLSGLAGDSLGSLWPYFGLGLGRTSVAQLSATMASLDTLQATAFHASLGFLHRPGLHLIWGAEGRYLVTFTNKDRKDFQASLMAGFTWGGGPAARRSTAESPAPEVKVSPPPAPAPVVEAAPPTPPPPVPPPPVPVPVVAAPPPPAPVVEAPLPPPPPPPPVLAPIPPTASPAVEAQSGKEGSPLAQRLEALRQGDMAKALELGRKHIEAIPTRHWTIRLEIANLPSTLANAVKAFPSGEPDLFIAPIKLKGGRTAYQLFLGDYPTKAEAERAATSVPSFFLEGRQRPKPFLVKEIPAQ